ncbi:MAG: YibE/F family protein [Bacillota bacterium]|nr:YibE/F family protein [Bacillota bacterium]
MRNAILKTAGILILLAVMLAIMTTCGSVLAGDENNDSANTEISEIYEKGKVLTIEDMGESSYQGQDNQFLDQKVRVKILSGKYKGQEYVTIHTLSGSPGIDIHVQPGDEVVLYLSEDNGDLSEVYISDVVRANFLNYIVIAFVILLVLVGGIKGIKALVALGLTILAIFKVLLPALVSGYSPLPITTIVLAVVTVFTMIVVAGFTSKSFAATLGTIGGVMVAGFLAYWIGDVAHLYGLATEESRMLLYVPDLELDMRGLLFSGIIIGALGAIMDVAMSIASSMDEVRKANPGLSRWELMVSGMNVGRDIMGTMANTLILAYTGGALPFLLLFMAYDTSSLRIMNSELIASEIVRAMVGSIGLILSVPITAFSASIFMGTRRS